MVALAFVTARFIRPTLRTVILPFLAIVIASMTMIKSVQAAGTVPEVAGYWHGGVNYSSAAAACVAPPFGGTGAFYIQNNIVFCLIYGGFYYGFYITNTCPANSIPESGSCTCNTNFKPDPTATICVPEEQLTISLSGLGGEVMPAARRAASAQVTTGTGSAKSGVHVGLDLTVVPENDGQLYSAHVGVVSPNGGATGADGRLNFVFTAPMAGGLHTITATCDGCSNQAIGTIRVSGCLIPPLTALTDRVAIDFDNNVGSRWRPDGLTPAFQAHLACVETAIDAATGVRESYTGTSAYRPTQYQQHLFEIVQKDKKLFPGYMALHPECQALRNEVTGEMGPSPGHALTPGQQVAIPGTSRHESGTAFDLTPYGLTETQLTPIYAGCSVSHTAVTGEPWHVQ